MANLKEILSAITKHKYLIATVLFLSIVGFLDENSLWSRMKLKRQIEQVSSEIKKYRQEYEESTRKLGELISDSVSIERIAREKYFMKKPNEDIFVFEEDLENE